ncbi:translation initiation factor IF-2-like [Branchiostoma floridae]|uniref:Translation initiation factor IF-2-like n=1 Tax=Branchiostoma floridae TaxID=7739 RepID=A0A9J7KXG9_BRAFL|nr:translation initiation factor IF-2-like [Branchiostoma floridae]
MFEFPEQSPTFPELPRPNPTSSHVITVTFLREVNSWSTESARFVCASVVFFSHVDDTAFFRALFELISSQFDMSGRPKRTAAAKAGQLFRMLADADAEDVHEVRGRAFARHNVDRAGLLPSEGAESGASPMECPQGAASAASPMESPQGAASAASPMESPQGAERAASPMESETEMDISGVFSNLYVESDEGSEMEGSTTPPGEESDGETYSPPSNLTTRGARGTRARSRGARGTRARGTRARGTRARGTRARGTRARGTRARGTRARGTRARGTRGGGTGAGGTGAGGTGAGGTGAGGTGAGGTRAGGTRARRRHVPTLSTDEQRERMLQLRAQRAKKLENRINRLSTQQLRTLVHKMATTQPAVIIDIMMLDGWNIDEDNAEGGGVAGGVAEGRDVAGDAVVAEGRDVAGDAVVAEGPDVAGDAVVAEGRDVAGDAVVAEGPDVAGDAVVAEGPDVAGDAVVAEGRDVAGDAVVAEGPDVAGDAVVAEGRDVAEGGVVGGGAGGGGDGGAGGGGAGGNNIVPEWCTCGKCRNMPTDQEKICCGGGPESCLSECNDMVMYILDPGVLRINRFFRNDLLALRDPQEPGSDHRESRHAAYRTFVLWQYGRLGEGNRVVVPSCCVLKIRKRFPDPFGIYTGFIPHRLN